MSSTRERRRKPVVGIAADVAEPSAAKPRSECALTYAQAVERAGGVPVVLPPLVQQIPDQLALCAAFVFTGGDDPRMELFGAETHQKSRIMHPLRQAYDVMLLRALMNERMDRPVLGICLGMQLMALVAAGTLDQYLPESLATHEQHAGGARHALVPTAEATRTLGSPAGWEEVVSHHRQAVRDPGAMRVLARSADGVIEAIERPGAGFFVGVQWHPERTGPGPLGDGMFQRLIEHCYESSAGASGA